MSEEVNIAIIGGGVVGCALAWELASRHGDIYLFEKNPGITQGENQSSRNSGVIHAGVYYDQESRPLKARLCVEGNRLLYRFCERYEVPCRKTGKLIVAVDQREDRLLDMYLQRARQNGVPGVRKLSGGEAGEMEPNVRAYSALFLPTSGIVEPTSLVHRLYALASNRGVQFLTQTEVVGLKPLPQGVELRIAYRDGVQDTVRARRVINAGGVNAVRVARMLDPSFPLRSALVRGDSLKFYRNRRPELYVRGMNIYPTPQVVQTPSSKQFTVGVHLTPTFDLVEGKMDIGDTVTLGPKLVPISHSEDYQTPVPPPEAFLERLAFFPGLRKEDLQPHQSGVQARLDNHADFYIGWDRVCPQCLHLVGIDSPGLTAALAIAEYVSSRWDSPSP